MSAMLLTSGASAVEQSGDVGDDESDDDKE
jgi:hypothetical protein